MIDHIFSSTHARLSRCLGIGCAIVLLEVASGAHAAVLLDTFAPGDSALGLPMSLTPNPATGTGGGLAVHFSTAATVTVDSILAAIDGSGAVSVGIMASVAGLPSGTFLHSSVFSDPVAKVSLGGLGWTLAAGEYWLAAQGSPGFSGQWTQGSFSAGPLWASNPPFDVQGWTISGNFASPAARIATAASSVPEPSAAALAAAALCIAGALARRRS